jgi:hypothetical protein
MTVAVMNTVFWDVSPCSLVRILLTCQKNVLPLFSELKSKPSKSGNLICLLLADCLAYFLIPEDDGSMFFRNVGKPPPDYTVSHPSRSSSFLLFIYLASTSISTLLFFFLFSYIAPVSLSDVSRPKCQIANVSKTSICKQLSARFGSLPFYFSLLSKLSHTAAPAASRPYISARSHRPSLSLLTASRAKWIMVYFPAFVTRD